MQPFECVKQLRLERARWWANSSGRRSDSRDTILRVRFRSGGRDEPLRHPRSSIGLTRQQNVCNTETPSHDEYLQFLDLSGGIAYCRTSLGTHTDPAHPACVDRTVTNLRYSSKSRTRRGLMDGEAAHADRSKKRWASGRRNQVMSAQTGATAARERSLRRGVPEVKLPWNKV